MPNADTLAKQQHPRHHPAQQRQVPFVGKVTVLTQEGDQLKMPWGFGLVSQPTLTWLPALPMS